jgi:hypothetical protein
MTRRSGTNASQALRKDWRCWIGVIETVARGRAARLHTHSAEYQALYQRLMDVSSAGAHSGEEAQRGFFEVMEATVRPWLSPRVLEQADREILSHLLERCRRIDRVLAGRGRASWSGATPILLFFTALVVSFVLLWFAHPHWSTLALGVSAGTRLLWTSVERLSHVEQLFAVGVVVVLMSIYNVSRAARS